jgi:exodeoxyribonuclease V alpha subunit
MQNLSLGFEPQGLTGVLERILYFNDENHYCIGELKEKTNTSPIIVAGTLAGVQCGETLYLQGAWVEHAKYGKQFKVDSFESKLPATVYGIERYLSSGLVQGIGKIYAKKIVDYFGVDTFRIISEESGRLGEVEGIGKGRALAIKKAWDSQAALREVMLFLKTYGVGTAQCLRLVKAYGNEAKTILMHNPYRVARDIQGIGFKTADKIAINLGFANDSEKRIDAGILFAIESYEEDGHTCINHENLLKESAELLAVGRELIEVRLKALLESKDLVGLE